MNRASKKPRSLTHVTWVAMIAGTLFVACSPQKTVKKYNYLLDEKGRTYTDNSTRKTEKSPTAYKSAPVEKESSGKTLNAGSVGSTAVSRVIAEAESYLGTPYSYGGTSKNGIDCSALTQNAWAKAGVTLNRSSRDQAKQGKKVGMVELKPGDIAVFASHNDGKINHVGLVIDKGNEGIQFIHATTSYGVRVDRLDEGYWKPRFMFGRRVSHMGSSVASN